MFTVLAEIDTLPDSQIEPAAGKRNRHGYTQKCTLEMRRHIVAALKGVSKIGLAVAALTEEGLHVRPYGRVGIFIDTQRGAGVFDKEMDDAVLDRTRFQAMFDLMRNKMKSPGVGA